MNITLKQTDGREVEIPVDALLSEKLDLQLIGTIAVLVAIGHKSTTSSTQQVFERWITSPEFKAAAVRLKNLGLVELSSSTAKSAAGRTTLKLNIQLHLDKL